MLRSVFLVDDDPTNCLVLSTLLEDCNINVSIANSYKEALARISANEPLPEVVLLDQGLGDGFGVNLVPEIRKRSPGTRIIFLSGSIDDSALLRAGADGIAMKGLPFPKLLALLDPPANKKQSSTPGTASVRMGASVNHVAEESR